MIFSLPNPIPLTVRDPEDLGVFFEKYGIIPYYGTSENTSHTFLDLLNTLTDLSPSFNMVMRDLKEYTFGLNIDFVGRAIPGLAADPIELSDIEKSKFALFLSDYNITLPQIRKLSKRIDQHLAVCGNAYLRIRRIQEGSTTKYFLSVPHYKHVAYMKSQDRGERFLIVSKFLGDLTLMSKYPPLVIPATQAGDQINWSTTESGVEEAVIHVKIDEDSDESDYYARPDILAALTWLYTDFQLGNLNSKIAATELITKVILAFQAPDPNSLPDDEPIEVEIGEGGNIGGKQLDYFERNVLILKNLTSNLGSNASNMDAAQAAHSIAAIEYPFGSQEPTPIPLEMNRDTAHQTWQSDQATAMICATLGWAPELVGMRKASATLGGNLIYDLLTMKNMSTIKPRQIFFQDLWNGILGQINQREGGGYDNYGIRYPDVVEELLTQFGRTPAQAVGETDPAQQIEANEADTAYP